MITRDTERHAAPESIRAFAMVRVPPTGDNTLVYEATRRCRIWVSSTSNFTLGIERNSSGLLGVLWGISGLEPCLPVILNPGDRLYLQTGLATFLVNPYPDPGGEEVPLGLPTVAIRQDLTNNAPSNPALLFEAEGPCRVLALHGESGSPSIHIGFSPYMSPIESNFIANAFKLPMNYGIDMILQRGDRIYGAVRLPGPATHYISLVATYLPETLLSCYPEMFDDTCVQWSTS